MSAQVHSVPSQTDNFERIDFEFLTNSIRASVYRYIERR